MSQWFAIQTNPRCESRATASVEEKQFSVYMPRKRDLRIHHRTKAEIEKEYPLLVGYVFVLLPSERHVSHIRGCDGVKCVLNIQGRPIAIPPSIVERIHDAEFRGEYDQVWHRRKEAMAAIKPTYRRGDMVEVTKGVFASRNGVVAKMLGRNRALVQIEGFLGAMAELSMPLDEIALAA